MSKKDSWCCSSQCKRLFDASKKPPISPDIPDNPSNRDILIAIKEIKQSQDFLSEKYDVAVQRIEAIEQKFDLFEKRISGLEKENSDLKRQIKCNDDGHKQQSRTSQTELACNVIISGVSNGVTDIGVAVKSIAEKIDDSFAEQNVIRVARLFTPKKQNEPDEATSMTASAMVPLVVTLSSTEVK